MAGDCCAWMFADGQRCNAPHGALIVRPRSDPAHWQPWEPATFEYDAAELGGRLVRVVLTTARRCACGPSCGELDHLVRLCQLHARRAAATRRAQTLALPLEATS